jgi:hypothetical protein
MCIFSFWISLKLEKISILAHFLRGNYSSLKKGK